MANTRKKVVLFGAGASAKYFIKNNKGILDIISCVDNNPQLWGTYAEEVLIRNPEFLQKMEFDQVIVTTQWSEQVRSQIINLGISKSKILIPDRRLLNPLQFDSEERQKVGIKVIKYLVQLFANFEINLVIDMGTLLGIYRDGKLISWDSDIDFMLFKDDMEKAYRILAKLVEEDFIDYRFGNLVVSNDANLLSQIEVTCFSSQFDKLGFPITINARENRDNLTVWIKFPDLWSAPREHFDKLEFIEFDGLKIPVPALTEKYLAYIYGPNWITPNPSFTYSDYPNQ